MPVSSGAPSLHVTILKKKHTIWITDTEVHMHKYVQYYSQIKISQITLVKSIINDF